MKNVAGFDVSRLIAGSLGTLGVILEASLKCLPRPKTETTVVLEVTAAEALRRFNDWSTMPLPLSASCWHGNRLTVRLSGADSAVGSAAARIGGDRLPDAEAFWTGVREQRHPFFREPRAGLWRASVRATALQPEIGGEPLIEWGGALRWFNAATQDEGQALRAWAGQQGGHATLFRAADKSPGAFQPLSPALLALHQRLKAALDPAGILNPRRMYVEL
jgi:glycolate oxidase FAD binding subunit